MTTEKASTPTKLCPTCGTRVSEDAARCLVCGADLNAASEGGSRPVRPSVQGSRMPELTLSLPAALGLLALFLSIGAVLVYFAMSQTGGAATAMLAETLTPTATLTETAT
ncbi:MAG TPA: hypothetical protein VLS48_07265, partial [Anaerolineales bacterium]|nr:hypothetical protein [Anaerolineales bacterium]